MSVDPLVISGVGAVTALGLGVDAVVGAVERGASALGLHRQLPYVTAHVADADLRWPTEARWKDQRKYAGRTAALALTAVDQALPPTGPAPDPERTVSVVCVEPDATEWRPLAKVLAPQDARTPAERVFEDLEDFHILRTLTASCAQAVAMRVKSRNGVVAVPAPSAKGVAGLGLALRLLRSGEADTVVVAAVSQALAEHELAARAIRRLLCTSLEALGDGGGAHGEGAVALVIERETAARARGVTPLARLVGAVSVASPARSGSLLQARALAERGHWPAPAFLVAPAVPLAQAAVAAHGVPVVNPALAVGTLAQGDGVLAAALAAVRLAGGVAGPAWVATWGETEDASVGLAALEAT